MEGSNLIWSCREKGDWWVVKFGCVFYKQISTNGLMYVFILLLIFTNFIGPAVHIRGKGLFMMRFSQGYEYKMMK